MRRSRRGGGSGVEFGSSGEDSFVAVVVTKLTGALLFILLLTMVIMALLPKAVDLDERKNADVGIGEPERAGVRSRFRHRLGYPRRLPGGRTWWRWRRPAAAGRRNGRQRGAAGVADPGSRIRPHRRHAAGGDQGAARVRGPGQRRRRHRLAHGSSSRSCRINPSQFACGSDW